jgi:hypothetical protein
VRKLIGLIAFLLIVSLPVAAQTQQPIRVNCGGPSYTDSLGHVWAADYGYNEGTASTVPAQITGTNDPALYQDGRWNGNPSVPMTYTFPVLNGNYHVNLYFTEAVTQLQQVGARVFDVKIQGAVVFPRLDIFAEAGADGALIKGADVTASNGKLVIEFDSIVQNPKVHAIEILPGTSGPALTLNFKYPDGNPVVGTLSYAITSSLLSFQGTAPLTNGQAQCVLYTNPSAMGISTQFTVNLNLTDSAGHQLWQLSLGMNPAQVNLGAIQTSSLNVIVQKL